VVVRQFSALYNKDINWWDSWSPLRILDMISPNQEVENDEQPEGIIADEGDVLSLKLTDEEIIRLIGTRVEDAKLWWDKTLDLTNVRKKAEDYYLNKSYDEKALYKHQIPYKNNRIITAVETLVPMITAQPAEPVVTEAQDTDESRQLAQDLQDVLLALYEDLFIKAKLSLVARHLMTGKRCGVMKYRYDSNAGKLQADGTRRGKICVDVVRPEKIVFEQRATDPDNIPLICEYLTATVEELILKFPKKKAEILRHFGLQENKQGWQKIVSYQEVWFTFYDEEGKAQEAVCWKLEKLVLDSITNPNWNYDEYETDEDGNTVSLNFFDVPKKPYIIFNHLTLGKYILDDTSLAEQSFYLQDVLNKRGRQITENADQAAAGLVINANMVSQEDAKRLIGDPTEKLMVDGDVRAAAARLPVGQLPAYVMEDKYDARAEIDNLFGANAPIRGESSGVKTLGQEIISQRANMGRLQAVSDSIEDGMGKLYPGLVQLMKVFWDETEIIRFQASEGKTKFINWNRGKIEDGIQVRIKAGSVLPKDKQAIKNETIQLAAMLDPLSLAEGLDVPNPKEFAKRITYFRFFMDKYLEEIVGTGSDGINGEALRDIQNILNGMTPEIPANPEKEYLATLQTYLESDHFKNLPPENQTQVAQFAEQVNEKAKTALGEEPTQETPPEELPPEAAPTEAPPEMGVPAGPTEGVADNFLQRGMSSLMNRFKGGQ